MKHALSTWDTFGEVHDIQNRLATLFRRENGNGDFPVLPTIGADWAPAVDISEDENEYLITADLPEVDKKDVKVTMDGGVLSISGERKHESEEKDAKKKFHRIERSYGRYERSFRLPDAVSADKLSAKFENGVLKVYLPKSEDKKPKQIAVAVA